MIPQNAWPFLAAGMLGGAFLLLCSALRKVTQAKRRWYTALACERWLHVREAFVHLLGNNAVDVHSATFQALFRTHMIALDSGDMAQVVAEMESLFRPVLGKPPAWLTEQANWPDTIWPILEHMAQASHLLAACQPGWGAALLRWRLWRIRQGPHGTPTNFLPLQTVSLAVSLQTTLSLTAVSHQLHRLAHNRPRPILTVIR